MLALTLKDEVFAGVQAHQKEIAKQNKLIERTNAILAEATGDDLEFVAERGYSIGRRQEPIVQTDIVSEKHIRSLATNYRLRFLSLDWYKGELPMEAVPKMREAEKMFPSSYHRRYYVLAPAKAFELTTRPVDPILFLSTANGYYPVHVWGNDMLWFRKILLAPIRSERTVILTLLMLLGLGIYFMCACQETLPGHLVSEATNTFELVAGIVIVTLSIVGGFIGFCSNFIQEKVSKNTWNERYS